VAKQKTAKVDEFTAVEELAETIQDNGKTIDGPISEQAELAKAMKEATAQRKKEKAKNLDTMACQCWQSYNEGSIGNVESFLSQASGTLPGQASSRDGRVHWHGGKFQGVIGMMEVIENDFARLEAAAEEQAKESLE